MTPLSIGGRLIRKTLIIGLLCTFASRLYLISCLDINWDEFNYLAHVYSFVRGEEIRILQSFHVYLFSWLTLIPGNEITQIIVARYVMMLLQVIAGVLLFKIARKYFSVDAGLFTVWVYFGFSYVMVYGFQFRFDPIITFLLILAVYLMLMLRESLSKWIWVGLLVGIYNTPADSDHWLR